jgi:RecB family exonuclease
LQLFRECPLAWKYRYIDGVKEPGYLATHAGSAFHAAAKEYFGWRMKGNVPTYVHMYAVAQNELKKRVNEGVQLNSEQKSMGLTASCLRSMQHVGAMILHASRYVWPDYAPLEVERCYRLELPCAFDLLGYIDLVTKDYWVVDWKTTSKAKQQSEADESLQLTAYYLFVHAAHGVWPSKLQLSVFRPLSVNNVEHQTLFTTRTKRCLVKLKNSINAVTEACRTGDFRPCPRTSPKCTPWLCSHYASCVKAAATRQLDFSEYFVC